MDKVVDAAVKDSERKALSPLKTPKGKAVSAKALGGKENAVNSSRTLLPSLCSFTSIYFLL